MQLILHLLRQRVRFFTLLAMLALTSVHAQMPPWTNAVLPVVSIAATDPFATWSGDSGTFTVFRQGPTNSTLNVYYLVGGTAVSGEDYAALGNWVTIPAGERTNSILVTPLDKGQTGTETVTLKLAMIPGVPPINYTIGMPSSATVYISPTPSTNVPPMVRIASPQNGTFFKAPANIPICAEAADPDGYVATVEFFAGETSLGVTTNNPVSAGARNPFCLVWSNVPPGDYVLTALATDNGGATAVSPPVTIMVETNRPGPTNPAPLVRITSPPNGAIFRAPVDVPIFAYARDWNGAIISVEFFADDTSLGVGRPVCELVSSGVNPPLRCPTNVFVLVWSNAPVGSFKLTAKATDSSGLSSVSLPVALSILPAPPPPTNRPPIVSIVATDPIAIEGTNCWPWLGLTNASPSWGAWAGGMGFFRYFTNCGPKNATFAIRRFGATNDDLEVSYAIGGTATNGVDYLPLSGSVVIPAGERRALLTVVPLDDGPPDVNSTVVLKLIPTTNYLVGFPRTAAALIVDGEWPRPGMGLMSDHSFSLSATGPDGAWFHVDYSTNMIDWVSICTNQVVNGSMDFIDPDAGKDAARFYRTVPETSPPSE